MSKNIYATTLRLNLDNPADRAAWEHLQRLDRVQYRSVSRAVVAAVNAFFDRQERLASDPYLETREKEDCQFASPACKCRRAGAAKAANNPVP